MTLSELQAKRDDILNRLGIARIQFGERSTEYSDAREALNLIDREIVRLQSPQPTTFTITGKRGI